jgi:hypothetical protein
MTRESGHAAHLISDPETTTSREGARNDSVSDLARLGWPDRDRIMGGFFVSAEIIPFTPRPNRRNQLADFPGATRSAVRPDDLTMDHADTAPCEYLWPCEERYKESERT